MQIQCKLAEEEIRQAISAYIGNRTGVAVDPSQVVLQVKSKQNYKAEWEEATVRAEFTALERQ